MSTRVSNQPQPPESDQQLFANQSLSLDEAAVDQGPSGTSQMVLPSTSVA
ncbi:hypothetical protein EV13_1503 [Prochlorococcus sp. MIT 0702]|nr:hypothetical protein EV13_1503 [Prochlorococcus sp. MIT 0702]KGG29204.1 hypothetical protein EV12_0255 [Prochlorococcus sp. MIT 0701]KGG34501.1 hypothetical protein EV14_1183 [Prochlorococcus sp. MIT 0703]